VSMKKKREESRCLKMPHFLVGQEKKEQEMTKNTVSDSSDNTARSVEKALSLRERSYRTLAENLPGIVYRVHIHEKGRMQFFNNMLMALTGYKETELIKGDVCSIDPLIVAEDHDRVIAEVNAAVKDNRRFTIEYRITHKDGALLFFSEQGRPIFDNDELHYIDGIILDITDRKRVEEALRRSEVKYRQLVESVQEGIWVIDKDSFTTFANPHMAKMLGYSVEEMQGKHLFSFMDEKGKEIAARLLERRAQGIKEEHDFEFLKKDGTKMYAMLEANPLTDEKGAYIGAIAGVVDVTARKKADEILRNVQKLESLGLIAGGIAHNFNNLMGGIFGYIDMASEASKDDKVLRCLLKAINTIDRARGLTAQLLTFAKGGGPVQINTPLIPFVQETAQITLSRLNVPCKFDIADDLRPCSIDKTQIGQVFDNIIINAQQAMPNGGSIDLSAKNVSLEESDHPTLDKGNYVRISIKDYGIGIQRENLSRLFDPFYTTKPTGQGLGLATCYSIISRHGGAIDVESEPGKGSTFHIYLPAASSENVSSSITKSATMNLEGSGTFLIMDDEEVMRETTTDMLESLGYSVVSKENGRDTVDFYIEETKANRSFAGLILDLTIPHGMGGKATVAEIRKLNTEIPIFVASGYADDPVVKNPMEYGFTASICKPFRKKELSEMLNKYLKPKK
jgi:PAS domain S-box-containing protein